MVRQKLRFKLNKGVESCRQKDRNLKNNLKSTWTVNMLLTQSPPFPKSNRNYWFLQISTSEPKPWTPKMRKWPKTTNWLSTKKRFTSNKTNIDIWPWSKRMFWILLHKELSSICPTRWLKIYTGSSWNQKRRVVNIWTMSTGKAFWSIFLRISISSPG